MSKSDAMGRNTADGQGSGSNMGEARQAVGDAGDYLREAASSATDAAELTYEELRAQLDALKGDLVGVVEAARSAGVETARSAYVGTQRAGRKAAEIAEDGYEIAGEGIDHAFATTENFVRARPATSVGLAAGTGFLLAMYLSRR